jgi:hypothetical protein
VWSTTASPAGRLPAGKSLGSGVTSKEPIAMGVSPFDESRAMAMVEQASKLARQAATLAEAADIMEEAFNKSPGLRDRFASRVRLWRNGIVQ